MNDVWSFALQLTVAGIGIVFSLLALLWLGISLMLRLDRPSPPVASAQQASPPPAQGSAEPLDPDLAAAITLAVRMHRSQRRKEAGPEVRSHAPGSQMSRWLTVGRARQQHIWHPRRQG